MNDPITIGMVATVAVAVISWLAKMMIDEFKRSTNKLGQRLEDTIAKFDERIARIEEKQEKDMKDVQKELSSIKGDFATTFVLREDFFRGMNGVEDKMRTIDGKLDKLLMKQQ